MQAQDGATRLSPETHLAHARARVEDHPDTQVVGARLEEEVDDLAVS